MMTDTELQEILARQIVYFVARDAKQNVVRTDHAALRKAWLKQRFASFDYHELLLRLHEKWLNLLYTALARPEVRRDDSVHYKLFMGPAREIFDRAPKPGQLDPKYWEPGKQTGWARSIFDYDRDTGLDVSSTWQWMTEDEKAKFFTLWGYMTRVAQNIQYTVDSAWDDNPSDSDWILNERYTGPIDWPANWMDELPADIIADAQGSPREQHPNVGAGEPCPEAGWWFTPAKADSRRYFRQGEVMPALSGDYGETYWQWAPDQSAPRL